MPRCEECKKWFWSKRALDRHFDMEHYFPKREKSLLEKKRSSIVDDDESSIISSGVPVMAHPFYSNDDDYDRVRGGGGEFSGAGATGDWGGDSGNDADYGSSSDYGSSDSFSGGSDD